MIAGSLEPHASGRRRTCVTAIRRASAKESYAGTTSGASAVRSPAPVSADAQRSGAARMPHAVAARMAWLPDQVQHLQCQTSIGQLGKSPPPGFLRTARHAMGPIHGYTGCGRTRIMCAVARLNRGTTGQDATPAGSARMKARVIWRFGGEGTGIRGSGIHWLSSLRSIGE